MAAGTTNGTLNINGTLNATTNQAHTLANGTTYFSTLTMNNGTLANTFGQNTSGFGAFFFNSSRTITATGTNTISGLGVLGIVNGATLTLSPTNTSDSINVTGTIGQGANGTAGGLAKAGLGTVTLSGANIYTGPTTISNGTVSANTIAVSGGTSSLGNAASAVVLGDATNQGTLSYTGGATSYTRGFTINAGGGQLTHAGTLGTTLTVQTGGITAGGLFTVGGAAGNNIAISSAISSTGGLFKTGGDTLTLSGPNTYSGTTSVTAGTLALATAATRNNIASSSAISITSGAVFDVSGVTAGGFLLANGQTLSGGGTIAGSMEVGSGSSIAPGSSAGKLTTGAQTWAGGGTYVWDLTTNVAGDGSAAGTAWDLIEMNAAGLNVTAGGTTKFTVQIARSGAGLNSIDPADWFTIAHVGSVSGFSAANFLLPDAGAGDQWEIQQVPASGGGFNVQVSTVPEPGSLGLLGLAVAATLGRRRRRRQSTTAI